MTFVNMCAMWEKLEVAYMRVIPGQITKVRVKLDTIPTISEFALT